VSSAPPAGAAEGVWRAAAATLAFAVVHSALASRGAKAAARRRLGDRAVDGWYRPFYNAQALATFAAAVAYAARRTGPVLYEVRGAPALVMRAGQAAALGYAAWAVATVGLATFAGLPGLVAWAADAPTLPPAPEAQGPPTTDGGGVRADGPFALSRHPLNFAFGAVLWLQPRVTAAFAAFTAVSTAYLVAGSWHEEARLSERVGPPYEAYRRSGAPFFLPGPPRPPALDAPGAA
jgi:protein-S-isoprenylcysteine O-methyltransferase Ste14